MADAGTKSRNPERGTSGPQAMWAISSMGMELAAVITGFTLLGYFGDRHFQTEPVLLLIGVGLGVIGGGYSFMRNALRISRRFSASSPPKRTGVRADPGSYRTFEPRPATGKSSRDMFVRQEVQPADEADGLRFPPGFADDEELEAQTDAGDCDAERPDDLHRPAPETTHKPHEPKDTRDAP